MDESDDPITIMTVAAVAGVGMQAYGQHRTGQATEAQGKTQAEIMAYNAAIAEQQGEAEAQAAERAAQYEKQAAEYEARRHEEAGEELLARQRALYGKSGVLFRGSPLAVIEKTAAELEMDRLMILREGDIAIREGAITAGRARTGAAGMARGLRAQAKTAKRRGRYAARGATLAGAGTLLTGTGESYYRYKRLTT